MGRRTGEPGPGIIGQPTPLVEGTAKVTAEARYLEDLHEPGMLYGKIVRSPLPHARILDIDTSRGRTAAGGDRGPYRAGHARHQVQLRSGVRGQDAAVRAGPPRTVRYAGDEVAAVAALDEATAEEGRPPYRGFLRAAGYGAGCRGGVVAGTTQSPPPRCTTAATWPTRCTRREGDLEAAFAASDLIVEDEFETTRQSHAVMETRGCIAHWAATGDLTVWHQTQAPHTLRAEIARTLGHPGAAGAGDPARDRRRLRLPAGHERHGPHRRGAVPEGGQAGAHRQHPGRGVSACAGAR